jgi:tetratricopeptide (TPR) repeat protein
MDLRRASAIAAILLAAAGGAGAQEAPGSTFEKDLQAAKTHMKVERWAQAAKAFQAIFERNPGSADVIRRLGDIEADLRLCLFRAQAKKPDADDLFGEWAESLEFGSRKIVLDYPDGPVEPHWAGTPGSSGVLKIPLEEDLTVEFSCTVRDSKTDKYYSPFATFCFDVEKGTGYQLYPGFYYETIGGKSFYSDDSKIVRLDGGSEKVLAAKPKVSFGYLINMDCRMTRRGASFSVQVDGKTRVAASDGKYVRGVVGVSAARVHSLVVRGTVEETHFRSLVGAHYEREYREWIEDDWDRDEVIPAWARRGPAPAGKAAPPLLPGDAPAPLPEALAGAMEAWRRGSVPEFLALAGTLEGLPPRTAAYLAALRDLAFGRAAAARAGFDGLLEQEPGFHGALLHRGILRLRLRDLEGAAADLEASKAGAAAMPSLYQSLADLAMLDGDIERAHAVLGDAKVAGALTPRLEKMAAWVQRCREGPLWPKRYESRNKATVVRSDHSVELCREVADLVDRSYASYVSQFPKTDRPRAPLRVWVFSNREGYVRYAADLGRDLEKSAGAFIPGVGEMVLFVPDLARADFKGTVKHEAFHSFLHGLVDDAPTWFDEGYAQWFEIAQFKDGALLPGEPAASTLETLRDRDSSTLPRLRELLLMDHATFMKDAKVHYAQSAALVHYLVECKEPPGKRLLLEYLASLRGGMTSEEAFRKHLEPRLAGIESGFYSWLSAKSGGRMGR